MTVAAHIARSSPLGATVTNSGVNFSLCSRHATGAELLFFDRYQGHGSLGRQLVDGKPAVNIFAEKIPVRASVHTFGGLSGHAGQGDLVRWIGSLAPSKPQVFLTHGEARGREPLSQIIRDRYNLKVDSSDMFETIEI